MTIRSVLLVGLVISTTTVLVGQKKPVSDPFAISLAQQSVAALVGSVPVSDVTLNANVTSVVGSDAQTGSATFRARGTAESRGDLNLSGGARSDVRNLTGTTPGGAWNLNGGTPTSYAPHNCWIDASWFFAALSSLTQTANSNFVFTYIGQEQHGGLNTQHIQVFQTSIAGSPVQSLSVMDFYLDPVSALPLSIGFNLHPDTNMSANIPVTVNFSTYTAVNGAQIPFHFQWMINGEVTLDVSVTSAALNTGLPDSIFTLP